MCERFHEPVSAILELVSGGRKRKLENREQRPARKTCRFSSKSSPFAPQRLGRLDLTHGNVRGYSIRGNRTAETALYGWAYRIRTRMCSEKIHHFKASAVFGFPKS